MTITNGRLAVAVFLVAALPATVAGQAGPAASEPPSSRSLGEDLTSHAWSTGLQLTPAWLGRAKDAYGLGYSEQREPRGRERMAETYYRLALGGGLSVIANVQWVVSGPNQVSGGVNRNVVVPGLRALWLF